MASDLFIAAQTLQNEIDTIQAEIDALTDSTEFDSPVIRMVNETRSPYSVTWVDADFTALQEAMLDRLNTLLTTKQTEFDTTYPCLVDE